MGTGLSGFRNTGRAPDGERRAVAVLTVTVTDSGTLTSFTQLHVCSYLKVELGETGRLFSVPSTYCKGRKYEQAPLRVQLEIHMVKVNTSLSLPPGGLNPHTTRRAIRAL